MTRRSLAAGLPARGLRRAAAPQLHQCAAPAGILPFGTPSCVTLLGAFDAEGAEEVLVQLEPDGVVRIDHRLGQPVQVARFDLVDGGVEPRTVSAEALSARTQFAAHRLDGVVDPP